MFNFETVFKVIIFSLNVHFEEKEDTKTAQKSTLYIATLVSMCMMAGEKSCNCWPNFIFVAFFLAAFFCEMFLCKHETFIKQKHKLHFHWKQVHKALVFFSRSGHVRAHWAETDGLLMSRHAKN